MRFILRCSAGSLTLLARCNAAGGKIDDLQRRRMSDLCRIMDWLDDAINSVVAGLFIEKAADPD